MHTFLEAVSFPAPESWWSRSSIRGPLGSSLSSDFKLVYPPTPWHLAAGSGGGVWIGLALYRAAEGVGILTPNTPTGEILDKALDKTMPLFPHL